MTPTELIEAALREHMRVRLGERAFEDIVLAREIVLSGSEAEDAARIAVDAIAAALRAEGERERVRLVGEGGDTMSRGAAIHNAITGWEMAAYWVEGEPRRGHLVIHNERTDTDGQ